MQFYNGIIAPLIIEPLRYYFSNNTADTNLVWHIDEKKRTVDIGESFDFNKVAIQEKPRVIVTRGSYQIAKTSVTDNLAEARPLTETNGERFYTNMVMYTGTATITVEAKNKGTCELLADMVSHFIVWTRPIICDSQGWKEFGLPMAVSDVALLQDEDPMIPRFQINMSIPWVKEEHWTVKNAGLVLKSVIQNITPAY